MSTFHEQSDALHRAVQDFIHDHAHSSAHSNVDHARFDALAVAIAQLQVARIPGHRRLFARHGKEAHAITRAAEIPAVPTDVFKQTRVATFPEDETCATFRTSGTTIGARGAHAFRTLTTYEAGALASGRRALLGTDRPSPFVVGPPSLATPLLENSLAVANGRAPWTEPVPVLVLGPSPREVNDSSLGHMNALFAAHFGIPATDEETFFLRNDSLQLQAFRTRVEKLQALGHTRMLLLGTSFSYVHLLDALDGAKLPLPRETRMMQTGGFKGKSREVDAPELRTLLAETFAIDERAIVLEYGMTELSSQSWEHTAVDEGADRWILHPSPWQRIVAVDPETLAPVADGTLGIARIEDLANVDSAVVIQTQDLIIVQKNGGVQLFGRLPGAPPRGCSIAIDEMLGPK